MTLKERLSSDLKDAMRSNDERRKITVRSVIASIRNAEIAAGGPFDDSAIADVIRKR